jgi:hypothetical protein
MDTQTAATDALAGVLTTTDTPSAIIPAQAATPPSIHSITSLITIRLTRENFLLWKTQAVPEGEGAATRKIANPAFLRWYQ